MKSLTKVAKKRLVNKKVSYTPTSPASSIMRELVFHKTVDNNLMNILQNIFKEYYEEIYSVLEFRCYDNYMSKILVSKR